MSKESKTVIRYQLDLKLKNASTRLSLVSNKIFAWTVSRFYFHLLRDVRLRRTLLGAFRRTRRGYHRIPIPNVCPRRGVREI